MFEKRKSSKMNMVTHYIPTKSNNSVLGGALDVRKSGGQASERKPDYKLPGLWNSYIDELLGDQCHDILGHFGNKYSASNIRGVSP